MQLTVGNRWTIASPINTDTASPIKNMMRNWNHFFFENGIAMSPTSELRHMIEIDTIDATHARKTNITI